MPLLGKPAVVLHLQWRRRKSGYHRPPYRRPGQAGVGDDATSFRVGESFANRRDEARLGAPSIEFSGADDDCGRAPVHRDHEGTLAPLARIIHEPRREATGCRCRTRREIAAPTMRVCRPAEEGTRFSDVAKHVLVMRRQTEPQ